MAEMSRDSEKECEKEEMLLLLLLTRDDVSELHIDKYGQGAGFCGMWREKQGGM